MAKPNIGKVNKIINLASFSDLLKLHSDKEINSTNIINEEDAKSEDESK